MATDAARAAALDAICAVTEGGQLLGEALPELVSGLDGPAAARAGRLATETLRQAGRADRLLGPHLRQRPVDEVLNLLRLGTVELASGGAAHGVVNAAVDLAKARPGTRRAAGLVNAVLRRVAAGRPDLTAMPPAPLPKPLRRPLVAAWGKEGIAALEALLAQAPPIDLTARDGNGAALAAAVSEDATGAELLPTGSVRLRGGQVSALPGYADGAFWVQDAAAALPAQVLAPAPGARVLDLCAAPGGKTMQLAAAGARVTALDLSPARLERLRANLARTGLEAQVVAADAREWEGEGGPFDAVLLDAPCSATGTLRRHPDLPHLRAGADLAPLLALQARLIDRALALLRPGGRLVLCTCSLFPEEGEAQVAAALARHPGLAPDPQAVARPEWAEFAAPGRPGQLRILPWQWAARGGIDGFHIAALRKAPA